MRPIVFTLPEPAMPHTRVANVNGAMMDLISRKKIVPSSLSFIAAAGKAAPKAMPDTSAIRIQVVSDSFFIVGALLPTGSDSCRIAHAQVLRLEQEVRPDPQHVHPGAQETVDRLGRCIHNRLVLVERSIQQQGYSGG